MLKVELTYDSDCPNVREARAQLLRAFARAGLPPKWQEWERANTESPDYAHAYGSPTILVNGRDVDGALPSQHADCCRLYAEKAGHLRGVPSVETIASALLGANGISSRASGGQSGRNGSWHRALTVLPAVVLAAIPKLACPACWPAYAGLLNSLGLGFVNYTRYLLPLTAIFLALALLALVYRANLRRGYGPFALGVLAATIVMVGKFIFTSDAVMYVGIALLIGASFWNSWPRRGTSNGSCPNCVPAGAESQEIRLDERR
ncbi:MAG: MerC family mercury resistance protein [Armatimonadetes bacterium]|nr:MerC family mercury resistance protein [Armatimonadota bacterium]